MARRILGAFLIIQALAPLIVLAAFAGGSYLAVSRISRAAGQYRHVIGAQIDTAKAAFATANQGFTALGNYVSAVNQAVDGVATNVKNLASSIRVPLPAVRPIDIAIPGVPQFKQVIAGVEAAGNVVGKEIGKVTSLATVPAQLSEISAATKTFAREVRDAAARWIVLVLGVLSFGVAVWFLGSLVRIVGEVRRGWSMLLGSHDYH